MAKKKNDTPVDDREAELRRRNPNRPNMPGGPGLMNLFWAMIDPFFNNLFGTNPGDAKVRDPKEQSPSHGKHLKTPTSPRFLNSMKALLKTPMAWLEDNFGVKTKSIKVVKTHKRIEPEPAKDR